MDEATRAFFRKQQEDSENQSCVDCGSANPQWASVSHGCYISLESSGVHRSLGVHISFVRSTTMDSWKPIHLKLMELGGNRRLKAFFREHNIPDDMPIAQKYNTRAAEWYRRNLRAMAEGSEQPPPLPPGTGHLPVSDVPSTTQIAFAKAAASGAISAGGAFASDARHYTGYHDMGMSSPSSSPEATVSPTRRAMAGFGSDGATSQPVRGNSTEFLGGILSDDIKSTVSNSVWSTVGLVGSLASKAKNFAENKVEQARSEGWLDTALDTAKQAAQKGVEVGKATYTFVNEGGGKAVIGKTGEVIGSTAKTSIDWFAEQLGGTADNSAGLQGLSSGRMQGFGSDSPMPPSDSSTVVRSPAVARPSYHADFGAESAARIPAAGRSAMAAPSPSPSAAPAKSPQPREASTSTKGSPSQGASDFFNDEDWGDWK